MIKKIQSLFLSFALIITSFIGLGQITTIAVADDFPSKPIEVVTHAGLGGGTDTTARMLLIRTRKNLKNNAYITPKKGDGGNKAMAYVKSKPRDGHTVLAITPTHLFRMARGGAALEIDDFVGVARTTVDPIVIFVNAKSPHKTIEDLVRAGNKKPIKYGGTNVGSVDHISGLIFAREAKTKIAFVPFEGGGAIMTNLVGNQIDAAGLNLDEGKDQLDSGELRVLAVMADTRLSALPDTPTLKEKGINASFATVRGVVVLKGTPQATIDKLEAGFLKAMKHPVYQNYLDGAGLDSTSVAGAAAWDTELKKIYKEAREALVSLGLAK